MVILGFAWAVILVAIGLWMIYGFRRRMKDSDQRRANMLDVQMRRQRREQLANQIARRHKELS